MSEHHGTTLLAARHSQWTAGTRPFTFLAITAAIGLLAAVGHAAMVEHGYRRFLLAYVVAFAFVLSLSLGGLFFVIIQHLARAGWSVVVRRPAEALAANMVLAALLFVPIGASVLAGHGEIYPWAQPAAAANVDHHDHAGAHAPTSDLPDGYGHQRLDDRTLAKRAYLNAPFFVGRWVVMLAIWAGLGLYFWRLSVGQDASGDYTATARMERMAGAAALIFGLTVTLGAFDLLMSLNPHWHSTIFAVYYFAGAVVGALSLMILLLVGLQRAGMMAGAISESHMLDMGRLLFAFLFFWAYIAFSQYMLLWYANMPEPISWLRIRGMTTVSADVNAWSYVCLVLLFGHFLVPFAGLMSRHVKRRPALLAGWAAWIVAMHYLDLVWVVMPKMGPDLHLGLVEVGLLVAAGSLYLLGVLWRLRSHSLVPLRDPRLKESLAYETAY